MFEIHIDGSGFSFLLPDTCHQRSRLEAEVHRRGGYAFARVPCSRRCALLGKLGQWMIHFPFPGSSKTTESLSPMFSMDRPYKTHHHHHHHHHHQLFKSSRLPPTTVIQLHRYFCLVIYHGSLDYQGFGVDQTMQIYWCFGGFPQG